MAGCTAAVTGWAADIVNKRRSRAVRGIKDADAGTSTPDTVTMPVALRFITNVSRMNVTAAFKGDEPAMTESSKDCAIYQHTL